METVAVTGGEVKIEFRASSRAAVGLHRGVVEDVRVIHQSRPVGDTQKPTASSRTHPAITTKTPRGRLTLRILGTGRVYALRIMGHGQSAVPDSTVNHGEDGPAHIFIVQVDLDRSVVDAPRLQMIVSERGRVSTGIDEDHFTAYAASPGGAYGDSGSPLCGPTADAAVHSVADGK
jgi:hypothetical protein